MKKPLHLMTQLLFLVIFIFLILNDKVHLWIGLFLLGIAASVFLGRIFCGWICPINTSMNAITWIKKKLHLKNYAIPKVLINPWMRFIILALFISVLIFSVSSGTKVPLFPFLFVLGILITAFFPEEFWHFYLCPFGTILSFSTLRASHTMSIDTDTCNNCGVCKRICPANAVEKNEKHTITNRDCLICMECSRNCKQNSIKYK